MWLDYLRLLTFLKAVLRSFEKYQTGDHVGFNITETGRLPASQLRAPYSRPRASFRLEVNPLKIIPLFTLADLVGVVVQRFLQTRCEYRGKPCRILRFLIIPEIFCFSIQGKSVKMFSACHSVKGGRILTYTCRKFWFSLIGA